MKSGAQQCACCLPLSELMVLYSHFSFAGYFGWLMEYEVLLCFNSVIVG